MLALWYAHKCGLNTLYFSPDMAPFHAVTRMGSLTSGDTVANVTEAVDAGALEIYEEDLRTSRVDFVFESSPTLTDMSLHLAAYVELRNGYPDLIVIDTLNNVESQSDDTYGGLRLIEKELHRMARETGAAVLVVHHTKQTDDKPFPQGKGAIDGKIDKLFERIITVALNPQTMEFMMAVVKNRDGKCDTSGESYVSLKADPDRARFIPFHRFGGWSHV